MNEERIYTISTSSRYHFILTIIILPMILMIPLMSLIGKLEKVNKDLFGIAIFISLGLLFWGGWRLSKYTSKGIVKIQIIESGLKIKWIKNYILYKYSDRVILWNKIEWHKFTPDRYLDIFKIKTKGINSFKLEHDSEEKDDFRSFYAAFKRNIRERNKIVIQELQIREAPNMYDGVSGRILMGFGYIMIVAGLIVIPLSIINGQFLPASILGLLGAIGGGIFVISQVKMKQKRMNKSA